MSVNAKMTAIADAIRGKTGKTDALTLDQMATEIAGIQVGSGGSGGSSAVYSGSFTPAENVLTVEIDVGGAYTHFVCYALGTVTGHSVKATIGLIADFDSPLFLGMSTNNSGTSETTIVRVSALNSQTDNHFFTVNNTQVTRRVADNSMKIATSLPAGLCLGYFIGGVTYNWYAW